VTGTARIVGGGTFAFDAHSGPSGENPSGTVRLTTSTGSSFLPSVTCLAVDGNRATVGLDFLSGVLVFVEDNSALGGDAVLIVVSSTSPPDCSSPVPPGMSLSPVVGDIQVVDSLPVPTSKDQCKNGGWRNYPAFKNQGQCVAFVVRRGCLVQRGTITYRDPYCANPLRAHVDATR
jgi:hypothetical protein